MNNSSKRFDQLVRRKNLAIVVEHERRQAFEEVIRENLDIGRPSQVSLVFDRKVKDTSWARTSGHNSGKKEHS
jgi:hypothetical protein